MGDILRSEIAQKGQAEDKWSMIGDLVSKGEMAPEVRYIISYLFSLISWTLWHCCGRLLALSAERTILLSMTEFYKN